jgi:hypothetical protein
MSHIFSPSQPAYFKGNNDGKNLFVAPRGSNSNWRKILEPVGTSGAFAANDAGLKSKNADKNATFLLLGPSL